MYNLMEMLCNIPAVSGFEDRVRDEIILNIKDYCDYSVDNLGNIIAFKRGKKSPKNKVMLSAHMDEVGMIVTWIEKNGAIKIDSVGGLDPRVVVGRKVLIGENQIPGVIGTKAVHLQSSEEKNKSVPMSSLYADIGSESFEQTSALVNRGDFVSFDSGYIEYGDGFIRGKAIDDRFGCSVLVEIIKSELEYDCYFVFSVQEEVGLRGSRVASNYIKPDIALVFEATTAGDLPLSSNEQVVCELGRGPVVSYMDRATVYNRQLYNLAFDLAKQNNIPCQTKTMIAGGNDSGSIQFAGDGVRVLSISIPCRYLHTAVCTAKKCDIDNALKLGKIFLNNVFNI